jgi:hypothetical protein
MWYVYILHDPRTNKPFYVGKGRKYRMSATTNINQTGNALKKKFLTEIKNAGLEPNIEIVAEYENESDAFNHEKLLVSKLGRIIKGTGILTNYSEGGDSSNAGWIPSDQTRKLWSKQREGIKQSTNHIAKRVAKIKGLKRNDQQKHNCLLASIRRSRPETKAMIIEELEKTKYYRGLYVNLAKKYNCNQDLITRIHNNIDVYKEALDGWFKK